MNKNIIKIGKIIGVHGLNGALKFQSFLENKEFLSALPFFIIEEKKYKPLMLKSHKRGFLLFLEGINNRNLSEVFVGKKVFAIKTNLPKLKQDTYYWNDLIGIEVFEKDKYIGKIESIIETGANDVYSVKDKNNNETLVPAIASSVLSINTKERRMNIKHLEYLRPLNN